MAYVIHIMIMLNIYIILVLSLNIPTGLSGLLTLCQAAFYGIGAYVGAFFLLQFNWSFLMIVVSVVLLNGLLSLILAYSSIKLKGDYFVLASLGFQMIVYTVMYNAVGITKGPYGISGIPAICFFGKYSLDSSWQYLLLTLLCAGLVAVTFTLIKKSPFGRVLKSIGGDEMPTVALGRNVTSFKVWTFFLSSVFSGIAGVLYASYSSYIDPTAFTLDVSLFLVSALFIGGVGNVKGPVLGAAFVVLFPELLRFVGMPDNIAASLRLVIYGVTLILVIYFRPQGLLGEKEGIR